MRTTCIHCGTTLIPDAIRKHWAHCPKCQPGWAYMSRRLAFLIHFKPTKKGAPSRDGRRYD